VSKSHPTRHRAGKQLDCGSETGSLCHGVSTVPLAISIPGESQSALRDYGPKGFVGQHVGPRRGCFLPSGSRSMTYSRPSAVNPPRRLVWKQVRDGLEWRGCRTSEGGGFLREQWLRVSHGTQQLLLQRS